MFEVFDEAFEMLLCKDLGGRHVCHLEVPELQFRRESLRRSRGRYCVCSCCCNSGLPAADISFKQARHRVIATKISEDGTDRILLGFGHCERESFSECRKMLWVGIELVRGSSTYCGSFECFLRLDIKDLFECEALPSTLRMFSFLW